MWPNNRILELFGIQLPIVQAPMAGSVFSEMVVAVSEAGGLGSLPCAFVEPRTDAQGTQSNTSPDEGPIHVNFFCHTPPRVDANREKLWRQRLQRYYVELGLDQKRQPGTFRRQDVRPRRRIPSRGRQLSFGLPEEKLVQRVRDAGAKIVSSATSVDEARWLEDRGCDAIVAQGLDAAGHRGIFLSEDVSMQAGTMALVPQVVDAVKVPVIAAGGIADGRGIAAAFALGGAAVQIGTAYLLCPEAKVSPLYREALKNTTDTQTTLTNIFTGRPARGIINRAIKSWDQSPRMSRIFRSLPQLWDRFAQKPKRQDRATSPHSGPVKRRALLGSSLQQSSRSDSRLKHWTS